jgi:hypothetical protein
MPKPKPGTMIRIWELIDESPMLVLDSTDIDNDSFRLTVIFGTGEVFKNLYFERRIHREPPGDPYSDKHKHWNLHWVPLWYKDYLDE